MNFILRLRALMALLLVVVPTIFSAPLRADPIAPNEKEFHPSMSPSRQDYISLQWKLDHLDEAFTWAEKAKARVLLNLMQSGKVNVMGSQHEKRDNRRAKPDGG